MTYNDVTHVLFWTSVFPNDPITVRRNNNNNDDDDDYHNL